MNKEKSNKIKHCILNALELLIFIVTCYILLESIKFGDFFSYFKYAFSILTNGSRYIFTACLIILGITLIARSITKNNFICNIVVATLLLCITLVSYYKYAALKQPFVPYDILLVGNLNQISEFGFTGITMQMFFSISILVILLIIEFYINKKIKDTINLSLIKRVIIFTVGLTIIFLTCISPNRYKEFGIKNDNGDNYVWMGANAVFFMHLGDFYNPKPVRI